MANLVLSVIEFATMAHDGQFRKFSDDKVPYIVHTMEVAGIIKEYESRIGIHDLEAYCAAILHDVIEDTVYTERDIEERFGGYIAYLVSGMTETYDDDKETPMRKRYLTIERWKTINNPKLYTLKLADIYANLKGLHKTSKKFTARYIKGKKELLPYLVGGNEALFKDVTNLIKTIEKTL
jgi:(p)ppGpp synthase/HD superfamily hydrolase